MMSKSNIDKDVLACFKVLEKQNPEAKFLSESTLSLVDEWIDTGCYVLNALISGSMFKGVPKGRILGISGPSATGKTYILNKILASAQRDHDMYPVIFDTEIAIDKNSTEGVGLDPDTVKYVPVNTVEETRNQLVAFLDNIAKNPAMKGKFIVSIDSLGNLASLKEIEDTEKGKSASDMGLRAKSLKSMMRVLTYKAAMTNTTIIFSNHNYDDPSAMYPSMIKNQSGGKGPIYLASVLVQLAKKEAKQEDNNDDIIPEANKVNGTIISAMTVKNRFVPPFIKGEMYLNFMTGLDKYHGLRDMAVEHGIIERHGPSYSLADGTKLGYHKDWKNDATVWDTHILPKLDEKIKSLYRYSSG